MKILAALLLAALPLFAHAQYGATYTQRPAGGGCRSGQACTGTTITATTALVTPALTNSGLTTGRVPYSTTGGLQTDSANLTFDDTTFGVNDKLSINQTAGAGPTITAGTAATASRFATSWTQTRNYSAAATDYLRATFTTTGGGTATHASDNLLNLKTGGSGAEVSVFRVSLNGALTAAGAVVVTNTSTTSTFGNVEVASTNYLGFAGRTLTRSSADGKFTIENNAVNKNIEFRAIVPVIGACGTSPSVTGTDTAMVVTVGTGGSATTCAVTFSGAYTNAPSCVAQSDTDILPLSVASTTTGVTVSKTLAFTASSKLHIHCIGYV